MLICKELNPKLIKIYIYTIAGKNYKNVFYLYMLSKQIDVLVGWG